MKLSREELMNHIDKHDLIGFLILESIKPDFFEGYYETNGDIEIELKINGYKCNFDKFTTRLKENLDNMINKKCESIINEKCSKIDDIKEKLEFFENDLDEYLRDFKNNMKRNLGIYD